jgi:ABC-2 type transport system ATP-binding protein
MIKLTNLTKSYGSKRVLSNLNANFVEGKVYGIVGENGAGKTTLFRCIAGLEVYQGAVECANETLKNHLGMLFTEPHIFSKITGEEYINFLCQARNVEINDLKNKNIFDLPLNQYAATYSTGMKKKLAITAILLQQNEYFILDEPFNGVDIQSNIIITEVIHKLKSLNKIVIISSHIFSTLSETCDEIIVMKNGEFTQHVAKENFPQLEREMKEVSIGDRINKLDLK